ncbi:NAD(P)-binding protein [Aureobasidium pullulans]|nr:NAD(P)-binding protein [Aureobasidium pullulans]THY12830.1 NAD(P)-binding protein [Aureobasidium pullulans]THZ58733.1 NAD(P)-binding protein [Aureobasidium pullulans]THZ93369.1 NAD(P)-binding protein [Aureobasidium pullulans]
MEGLAPDIEILRHFFTPANLTSSERHTYTTHTMSLQDKIAVVTGASRGIGAAIAKAYAKEGAHIAIVYASPSSTESAEAVKKEIEQLGRKAILIQTDLVKADCGEVVLRETLKGFNTEKIDILVSNAGIFKENHTLEFDADLFDRTMAINVRAPAALVKSIAPHMPRGGRVVVISSMASTWFSPNMDIYCASKAAVNAMMKCWAVSLGKSHGITANAINPGFFPTDINSHFSDELLEMFKNKQAIDHRLAHTDDLTGLAVFLASEQSRWITGETVECSGGSSLG